MAKHRNSQNRKPKTKTAPPPTPKTAGQAACSDQAAALSQTALMVSPPDSGSINNSHGNEETKSLKRFTLEEAIKVVLFGIPVAALVWWGNDQLSMREHERSRALAEIATQTESRERVEAVWRSLHDEFQSAASDYSLKSNLALLKLHRNQPSDSTVSELAKTLGDLQFASNSLRVSLIKLRGYCHSGGQTRVTLELINRLDFERWVVDYIIAEEAARFSENFLDGKLKDVYLLVAPEGYAEGDLPRVEYTIEPVSIDDYRYVKSETVVNITLGQDQPDRPLQMVLGGGLTMVFDKIYIEICLEILDPTYDGPAYYSARFK